MGWVRRASGWLTAVLLPLPAVAAPIADLAEIREPGQPPDAGDRRRGRAAHPARRDTGRARPRPRGRLCPAPGAEAGDRPRGAPPRRAGRSPRRAGRRRGDRPHRHSRASGAGDLHRSHRHRRRGAGRPEGSEERAPGAGRPREEDGQHSHRLGLRGEPGEARGAGPPDSAGARSRAAVGAHRRGEPGRARSGGGGQPRLGGRAGLEQERHGALSHRSQADHRLGGAPRGEAAQGRARPVHPGARAGGPRRADLGRRPRRGEEAPGAPGADPEQRGQLLPAPGRGGRLRP